MAEHHCDVAIIGTGTAGLAAHAAARRHTDSLLLIDAGPYGTTCARVGCMPSKLLIAAADSRRHVAEAGTFGVRVPDGVAVDGRAVMRRVQCLRDDFVGSVIEAIERIPAEQRLRGRASFVDPHTLRVGDDVVHARAIVIATGSTPIVPAPFQSLGAPLLTTDTVFELPTLPGSLAVVGGGTIGLELGQAFHALGVRTRLFHRGATLGPSGDAAVSQIATRLFRDSLPCELEVDVRPVDCNDDGVELAWRDASGAERRERFEYVLVSTGRRPQLDALALARSGLALDERGVPAFDPGTMRCGASHVFVAGDVDGHRPLLHEAADDGRIAGENAARYPDVRTQARYAPLSIAFTTPQYASVGATLQALEAQAVAVAVGEVSFADQGRSRVIARNAGLARLYADRATGRLVGAQLLGPEIEHLAHLLAWSIQQALTVQRLLEMPYYHPVIEEGLRTALKALRSQLRQGPPEIECMDCGPGT